MSVDADGLAPLILVVGPSGVGKDALIAGARQTLAEDNRFHFVRRVVTRATLGGSEDYDSVSVTEFRRIEAAGGFLLSWDAHGLCYGVPRRAAQLRNHGTAVIANVSRRVIETASRELSPVAILAVTAPPALLAERLIQRGRETRDDILVRLQRSAPALPPQAMIVENDQGLSEGIARFVTALRACHPER